MWLGQRVEQLVEQLAAGEPEAEDQHSSIINVSDLRPFSAARVSTIADISNVKNFSLKGLTWPN